MEKIQFGVLGSAKIATEKVIPAMQRGKYCEIAAISSRDSVSAENAAHKLNIPRAYGSYQQLLDDPGIQAVYVPLPNHMHVPWAVKCLKAGKHVLCEKPIGLSSDEAGVLFSAAMKHPQLKVMEAFMYRHHPRWRKVVELVKSGDIGEVRAVQSIFSYHNTDPHNIRNSEEMGGGGLMDIGCYSVSLSRLIFGREPDNVLGVMERDPVFRTDRLTSGILDFTEGTSVFTCSTQCFRDQYVKIVGTEGKIEMDAAFNPPTDQPTALSLSMKDGAKDLRFEPCNQFTLQGDLFARAIIEKKEVPVPLEDAVLNMKVIDRLKAVAGYAHSGQ